MLAIFKQRAVPAALITTSAPRMGPRSVIASSRCAPLLSHRRQQHEQATATKKCCPKKKTPAVTAGEGFWTSTPMWKRSGVNTVRCLVGCTTGDFSTMWYLQSAYPELSIVTTMSLSMAAGIMTSILLETTLLHLGRDRLPWKVATRTATGMSLISMLAMEVAENTVDYSLTGGCVDLGSTYFWMAAGSSALAGFLVPLPYNYFRLRSHGKSCH